MTSVIVAEGLRFAYPAAGRSGNGPWVIDGLDLEVGAGEWLTLMGANDAGKSTLCLLLAGLAPHLTGGRMEGRLAVAGHEIHGTPPPRLADTVGILFQEPEAQLFHHTAEAEVAWGLENLGLPPAEIRARVDEMLALFRLEGVRLRAPGQLSGGQKKRLALASVLAMRPRILVLDEPMGGLDPLGQRELLAALGALRGAEPGRPVTIVMTESDPEAAAAFSDRVAVLHGGRLALEGDPRRLFRQVDDLEALGVAAPQLSRLAALLTRRMNRPFAFLTPDEARRALEAHGV